METSKGLGVTDGVKGLIGAQCFTRQMMLKREGERERNYVFEFCLILFLLAKI